jgi:3,4-dihydroxy 2-butanone 4-phosphate synthase/GTP cyclohydrolase II
VEVAGRVPLPVTPNRENLRYLMVKRDRLGHEIDGLPAGNGPAVGNGPAARPPALDGAPGPLAAGDGIVEAG